MSIARTDASSATTRSRLTPPTLELVLAIMAVAIGAAAWAYYFRAGLVLSHYDAKAHLVVARRVIDNLTPGWQQIGAVWLPLPHLLLLLPVQNDWLYRTGLAGSLISLACLGITAHAYAALIMRSTRSVEGAAVAVLLLALNPSLLYLHTTPMTEPLLLAVTAALVLSIVRWCDQDDDRLPQPLGWLLVAATWTRYEAWFVVAAAGLLALVVLRRRQLPWRRIGARAWRYAIWPTAAAVVFLIDSRITVGQWFVSDGFFVPDPTYAGQLSKTLWAILEGVTALSGWGLVVTALVGIGLALRRSSSDSSWSGTLVTLALFASLALPLAAFYDGHPFRIRYMTPLVAAGALWSGIAIGLLPRGWRVTAGIAVLALGVLEAPPIDARAPMVVEAQLDRPAGLARRAVSACLADQYRGEKVLASMGSLAHYMQELSADGFAIRDFVHEGNGVIWEAALETGPARHVGWMLVEEVAEGGDILAQRLRRDPAFVAGMTKTCASGGVSLYRRDR